MAPREAFLGTTRRVDLTDAAGEIGAEPVSPQPAGVPLPVPGQRAHDGHIQFLRKGLQAGMFVEESATPRDRDRGGGQDDRADRVRCRVGDGAGRRAGFDESDAGGFGAKQAWLYFKFLTVGYMISRGLAKSGSRDPYWDDDDGDGR
jgi:hypothetical protein